MTTVANVINRRVATRFPSQHPQTNTIKPSNSGGAILATLPGAEVIDHLVLP
jgi:hypothetical protein